MRTINTIILCFYCWAQLEAAGGGYTGSPKSFQPDGIVGLQFGAELVIVDETGRVLSTELGVLHSQNLKGRAVLFSMAPDADPFYVSCRAGRRMFRDVAFPTGELGDALIVAGELYSLYDLTRVDQPDEADLEGFKLIDEIEVCEARAAYLYEETASGTLWLASNKAGPLCGPILGVLGATQDSEGILRIAVVRKGVHSEYRIDNDKIDVSEGIGLFGGYIHGYAAWKHPVRGWILVPHAGDKDILLGNSIEIFGSLECSYFLGTDSTGRVVRITENGKINLTQHCADSISIYAGSVAILRNANDIVVWNGDDSKEQYSISEARYYTRLPNGSLVVYSHGNYECYSRSGKLLWRAASPSVIEFGSEP